MGYALSEPLSRFKTGGSGGITAAFSRLSPCVAAQRAARPESTEKRVHVGSRSAEGTMAARLNLPERAGRLAQERFDL
jgi:hypothetical protein